jgi:hypothetical protein
MPPNMPPIPSMGFGCEIEAVKKAITTKQEQ